MAGAAERFERGHWVAVRAYEGRRRPKLVGLVGEVDRVELNGTAGVVVLVNWTQNYDGHDEILAHAASALRAAPGEGSLADQSRKLAARAIMADAARSFIPGWGYDALVRFAAERLHRREVRDPYSAALVMVDEGCDFRTVCRAFS